MTPDKTLHPTGRPGPSTTPVSEQSARCEYLESWALASREMTPRWTIQTAEQLRSQPCPRHHTQPRCAETAHLEILPGDLHGHLLVGKARQQLLGSHRSEVELTGVRLRHLRHVRERAKTGGGGRRRFVGDLCRVSWELQYTSKYIVVVPVNNMKK